MAYVQKNNPFKKKQKDNGKADSLSRGSGASLKEEIKDNIGFDEQYNIFYDKDIQRSYEQQRGRFAPKRQKKNNQQNTDRLV